MSNITISPPPKPLSPSKTEPRSEAIVDYLQTDLFNYFSDLYKFLYFIWLRTGGYNTIIPTFASSISTKGSVGSSDYTLLEYTLPAKSLGENGHYIIIEGFGHFAANGNNKRLRLYFGSVVLFDTTSLALNSGGWSIKAQVYRVSSNSQKVVTSVSSSNSLLTAKSFYVSTSQNLDNDIVIKFVANGVANNDIVQEGLIVQNN